MGARAGIYNPSEECEVSDMDDPEQMMQNCVMNVCQPGNRLQCAGYVLYSSATNLVLTVGDGVYGFTLDPLVGEFVLSHNNIKVPAKGKIYSFNEGNYGLWDDGTKAYIDSLKQPEKWGGKPYSVRPLSRPSGAVLCHKRAPPMHAKHRAPHSPRGHLDCGMLCAV